ncbi:MAG: hypothetical protein FJ040_06340 [Chloroflexi bacterium]|nr:hypothetical protein [Chloroflexota bacterium]
MRIVMPSMLIRADDRKDHHYARCTVPHFNWFRR